MDLWKVINDIHSEEELEDFAEQAQEIEKVKEQ